MLLDCQMRLRRYPLDTQVCTLEIESYGYDEHEMKLVTIDANPRDSITGAEKLSLHQFKVSSLLESYCEAICDPIKCGNCI